VAAAYAEAYLRGYGADCITVNPYMGTDTLTPFVEEVRGLERGGGVFVLLLTSNPSAAELQLSGDPPLFERVAELVSQYGAAAQQYSDVGAVVGATRPDLGRRVRELLPETLFLVPGFGAQGGGVEEVKPLLDGRGGGVFVNSSRQLMYAYEGSEKDYRSAAHEAARRMRRQLQEAGVRT
jgi:orotidine-5'-phosphate decarboxylase